MLYLLRINIYIYIDLYTWNMQYLFLEHTIFNVYIFKISMSICNILLYMYIFYHIYLEL